MGEKNRKRCSEVGNGAFQSRCWVDLSHVAHWFSNREGDYLLKEVDVQSESFRHDVLLWEGAFPFLHINLGLYTSSLVWRLNMHSHDSGSADYRSSSRMGHVSVTGDVLFLAWTPLNARSKVLHNNKLLKVLPWNKCMQSELPAIPNTAVLCKTSFRGN